MSENEKPQLVIMEVLEGLGRLNALTKNIMAQTGISDPNEAIRVVNSGEYIVVPRQCKWREQDGVIDFLVTSNGKSGEEWIEHQEGKKFNMTPLTKSVLRSKDFKPMKAGTTIEIAVLKGSLFADNVRFTSNIRAEAERRKLTKPNAEIACLILDKFTDKEIEEMGLWWIVAMHEPIEDSDGDLCLLGARRNDGGRRLDAFHDDPRDRWDREDGFAFVVAQVSA